jgi:hypothetical protein
MAARGPRVSPRHARSLADHGPLRGGWHLSLEHRGLTGSSHERIGCLVVVGRWLRLGLVRPDTGTTPTSRNAKDYRGNALASAYRLDKPQSRAASKEEA